MSFGVVASIGSAVIGAAASNSASKRAARAQQGASDAAATQAQIGLEQWDRYKEVFAPLEDRYVADAQNYDSPENYAKAAGEASATVSEQFGKARDRLSRTPGLDPSSPAYMATLADLDGKQAAVDATQQNAARERVGETAWARKTGALSLGKGLPADAASMLGRSATSNLGLADLGYARANQQATGVANIASQAINAGLDLYTRPRSGGFATTDPTYGTGMGARGFDFSDNMQEYGL